MQVEIGIGGAQCGQEFRQNVGRNGWNDAKPQRPAQHAPGMPRVIAEIADAGEDLPSPPRDFFALRRELRARSRALDQHRAQLLLKLLNLHGQGWLRHRALLRRPAEVERARERVEVAELPQRDVCHQRILSQLQLIRIDFIAAPAYGFTCRTAMETIDDRARLDRNGRNASSGKVKLDTSCLPWNGIASRALDDPKI